MKNILLLGDSIRLGYQENVRAFLGEGYRVFAPADNCRYSKYTVWNLRDWLNEPGVPYFDAIHWNNGCWDLHRCTVDGEVFTAPEEYASNIARIAGNLLTKTDRLCFGFTIPGGKTLDDESNPNRKYVLAQNEWNAEVCRYNAIAADVLKAKNVRINDLYAAMIPDTDRYIGPDGVHPTEEGYRVLGRQVADTIRAMTADS